MSAELLVALLSLETRECAANPVTGTFPLKLHVRRKLNQNDISVKLHIAIVADDSGELFRFTRFSSGKVVPPSTLPDGSGHHIPGCQQKL